MLAHLGEQAVLNRDHNATSYSTETNQPIWNKEEESRRDHNATSYSTETFTLMRFFQAIVLTEIITLRAIALKHTFCYRRFWRFWQAEIITLRAIALKPHRTDRLMALKLSRDHNATSYSTETDTQDAANERQAAEIITLRAIALKQIIPQSLILNIRTQRS